MAAKDKAEYGAHQGALLLESIKDNPYVHKVLADADLRDQVRDALDSSRSAYKRASKSKRPAQALINDTKLQKELKAAYEAAKSAQEALLDAPHSFKKSRKRGGKGKFVAIALLGGAVALVASSGLRDKVLDLLFGPEETFDYVPAANGNGTTAAASQTTPAPNAS